MLVEDIKDILADAGDFVLEFLFVPLRQGYIRSVALGLLSLLSR